MTQTKEEYLARFHQNQRIDGYGMDTSPVYPCPFCAAPDWATHRLMEMEAVMSKPHKCSECGRSSKMIFQRDANGLSFEVVQCGGDPPPNWLIPPPRRVEDDPASEP